MIGVKRVTLAGLLLAFQCAAQTPAELMQKGIYTQDTAGDLDGAIQIYRQVTGSAPGQSPIAAQAQYRIAEIMLQKGDLSAAATEFTVLASRYSESQALVAKMAGRLGGIHAQQATGVVRNGRYRNNRTGVEVSFQAPWTTKYDGPSSDDGDMLGLSDGTSNVDFGIWMRPESSTAAEIPEKLSGVVAAKTTMNAGTPGFRFRPESIQPRTIAGHQAVTAIADYVEDGQPMAQSYTWIYTQKSHVLFLVRGVPAADIAATQSRFDPIIVTAVVP